MNPVQSAVKLSFAVALLSISVSVLADNVLPSWDEFNQVRQNGKSAWQLDIDNDSLLLRDEDGFYTSGNRIGQSYTQSDATHSVTYGWRLGQDLYTASDIKLAPKQIPAIEHPYAGWLYAGVYKERNEVTGVGYRLGLDIGCLGPCAGGDWTQTHLHRLLRQPLPQGWSTQLRNEWGVIFSGEYSPGRLLPLSAVDLAPRVKAHFGNIMTDASAEVLLRAGKLNALPEQAASYMFTRAEVKAVAYNASIQGGYFNNQTVTVKHKVMVGELELGYLWRNDRYGLSASVIRRSNEIKEMSNGQGAQNFARLQFFYVM